MVTAGPSAAKQAIRALVRGCVDSAAKHCAVPCEKPTYASFATPV